MSNCVENRIENEQINNRLLKLLENLEKSVDIKPDDVALKLSLGNYVYLFDAFERRNCDSSTTNLFQRVLKSILSCIKRRNELELIENIFLRGLHVESFIFLCETIQKSGESAQCDFAITLLEKFLSGPSLSELLDDQCFCLDNANPLWDQLITYLVSIPDRLPDQFKPVNYVATVAKSLIEVLSLVRICLQNGQNISLEFVSRLIGRLSLVGHADLFFAISTPQLTNLASNDFLWRKMCTRVVSGVPDRCLEAVLKPLLCNITWFGYLKYFIGCDIAKKPTLKFILTKKFLIIRHFDELKIARNIIGYLAEGHVTLFCETLQMLLGVWSDGGAVKRMSDAQHTNLNGTIMMAIGHLKLINFELIKNDLIRLMLNGVQVHVSISTELIRKRGMIVGQYLAPVLDPQGPKLEFDFLELNAEDQKLIDLITIPPEVELAPSMSKLSINSPSEIIIPAPQTTSTVDFDSDDDLEPFDQSNDVPFRANSSHSHPPRYILDCVGGLTDHSDATWSQLCLENVEKLIKSQQSASIEMAPELAKILLHLENSFAAADYSQLRFKAMVAICVTSPKPVASYLTEQFYDRNYTIRQRLDILEVLATSSQQLSGLKLKKSDKKCSVSENKFSEIAGYFFYPLLRHYDRRENSIDLLGEDAFLLARLIYTLGVVVNSAANTIAIRQLASCLLQFLLDLRFHTECIVRQSVLFSLCSTFINISPKILLEENEFEIFEYQNWLQTTMLNDPDTECRRVSTQILQLFIKEIK